MPKDRKAKAKKARQKEQKAAELKKAHEKIEIAFYKELLSLLDKLEVIEHVQYFDRFDIYSCFRFRSSALIFEQVGSRKPTLELEEVSKALLQSYMKSQTYTYTNGAVISAYEVFHILESFRYIIGFKVRKQEPHYEEIKEKLWDLKEFLDRCLIDVQETIKIWLRIIGWIVSIPDKENILFKTEIEVTHNKEDHSLDYSYTRKFRIFYEAIPVERRSVVVEGLRRPCYRFQVGDVNGKIFNLTIKRELFGFKGTPIDVYFQSHALERLAERLDGLMIGVSLGLCITEIKRNPIVHDVGGGKYLLDVVINDIKLGYFVAYLIEGYLLIKTFLFVTNTSTPEGEKLDRLSGMAKIDKEYLGIDRLSTFLAISPKDAPELKELLEKAGLGYLLKMDGSTLAFFARLNPFNRATDKSGAISCYFKKRNELPVLSDLQ
ncbi:hypothetical protein [uncultured Acetobacteroides sp.]|uniref:hypothetical protein n=1 Tax=uncultured Acetobacteroides sp. TaxID=1760811 RepID=UPI0029F5BE78|nr:hypothetical protein [uncultured Acetobacteroides sp.]